MSADATGLGGSILIIKPVAGAGIGASAESLGQVCAPTGHRSLHLEEPKRTRAGEHDSCEQVADKQLQGLNAVPIHRMTVGRQTY